ncbi:protein HEG homolog 1 [Drosophila obscura]|uniref:protein HEG homolog 1 n=1 Tax=Drosophila obscura TaxID=7282 RepID=UPI001BB16213|nr:protein HEG homolog 1 [Drosophila obscura]
MTHSSPTLSSALLLCCTVMLLATAASGIQNRTNSSSSRPTSTARVQAHRGHGHRQRHHASPMVTTHQRQSRRMQLANQAKAEVELLPGVTMQEVTRLRRIHPHNPYNKVLTRRLHQQGVAGRPTEWDYNTYNIYTNTFGPPPPPVPPSSPHSGKGEDNTQDVEFIGVRDRGRGYNYVPSVSVSSTTAPPPPPPSLNRRSATPSLSSIGTIPPLVPARRGYVYTTTAPTTSTTFTSTVTTEDPYETNTIGRNYPTDPKEMERRHICAQQRTITMPVKTTEVYTRPTWKHISTPCQPQSYSGQMCTRVQVVHEPAYRDVIKHKTAQQMTYDCCTGWSRENPRADACMKPVCSTRCQNGGNCTAPQTCSCPSGYTGRHCELDVNECHVEKPCDQQCVNTPGSYFCRCRQGFELQADQQSCRKVSSHGDDAFEARDLENDIDEMDPEVATRLQKIERSLANERVHTNELQKSLQATYSVVDTLQTRLSTLEKQAQDVSRLQTNLYKTESRTNKLEGMLNLLLKCRNGPNANCP